MSPLVAKQQIARVKSIVFQLLYVYSGADAKKQNNKVLLISVFLQQHWFETIFCTFSGVVSHRPQQASSFSVRKPNKSSNKNQQPKKTKLNLIHHKMVVDVAIALQYYK
jgi:hypothetical protein